MFHIKLQFSSHWSAQQRVCLASSRRAHKEEQSTHELLILAHSTLLARRRECILALLSVPGFAVKGSTRQVIGCSRGGMQITMVPFQLWALKGGIRYLPDTTPAPSCSPWQVAAALHTKRCLSSQARELPDIYTLLQGHKDRRAASR